MRIRFCLSDKALKNAFLNNETLYREAYIDLTQDELNSSLRKAIANTCDFLNGTHECIIHDGLSSFLADPEENSSPYELAKELDVYKKEDVIKFIMDKDNEIKEKKLAIDVNKE